MNDHRDSAKLVHNNFPWPTPDPAQRLRVAEAAQAVLTARSSHAPATLADLYDPRTTPPNLAQAHTTLDRTVDRCYRPQPFPNERRRFETLLSLAP